jgi:hypothetical protein
VVAVFDLGGGTFDAAVLRRTEIGFDVLGEPQGIEHLGGIDFDAAVFHHVQGALGGAIQALDADDPAVVASAARLREECIEAKEALSSESEAVISVVLPNVVTQIRLTRLEFEGMIRPSLLDAVNALQRALRSAGIAPAQVSRVLLVGGSSRIPLVAELVSGALGRPIAIDAHPKHAVALGAAVAAAGTSAAAIDVIEPSEVAAIPDLEVPLEPARFEPPQPPMPLPTPLPSAAPPSQPTKSRRSRIPLVIAVALLVVALAVGGALLTSRGSSPSRSRTSSSSSPTTVTAPSSFTLPTTGSVAPCIDVSNAELNTAFGLTWVPQASTSAGTCDFDHLGVGTIHRVVVTLDEATTTAQNVESVCKGSTKQQVPGRIAVVCDVAFGDQHENVAAVLFMTRNGRSLQLLCAVGKDETDPRLMLPGVVDAFAELGAQIADPA